MIDFTKPEVRAQFIRDEAGWLYVGKNSDGEDVRVWVEQGRKMKVLTKHTSKPLWWECVVYDADGFQVEVLYEHV